MARQQFARRVRRDMSWTGVEFTISLVTTTQAVIASLSHDTHETVVRTMGRFMCTAVPDGALDNDVMGIGIMKLADTAIAAGGVAVPGPIADPGADWMFHTYVPLFSAAASAASGTELGLLQVVAFDVKSMRKVTREQGIVLIAEMSAGSFASQRILGGFRTLAME